MIQVIVYTEIPEAWTAKGGATKQTFITYGWTIFLIGKYSITFILPGGAPLPHTLISRPLKDIVNFIVELMDF